MFEHKVQGAKLMLLAGIVASGIPVSVGAQSASPAGQASAPAAAPRFNADRVPRRAALYYGAVWGIDSLGVKYTESGEIVRFSYRVLDPEKAKPLNDKKLEPSLIDPQAGVRLVVPSMDKIGLLRQSSTPEAGKSYWMGFSNKGRMVKPGHRVDVVIGNFRAEGLVVD
jgi:hypothetical protein